MQPKAWTELQQHMKTLENHYKDMCDIEFTVEERKLWLLQTRVGKRTARAEWVIALDMVEAGPDRRETAVRDRLTAGQARRTLQAGRQGDAEETREADREGT